MLVLNINVMKANLINICYNGVDVEVFYQEGYSYRDVFSILEKKLGRCTSLSRGVKRQFKDWPYQPDPYYKGDTHRVCLKGECLFYNKDLEYSSTGPTFGDLRLNG